MTIEDLLEEIVGEIRDEYDVEVEPVVDEADGSFVFSGRPHVRELGRAAAASTSEGEGFETVGGYLLSHVGRVPAVGRDASRSTGCRSRCSRPSGAASPASACGVYERAPAAAAEPAE